MFLDSDLSFDGGLLIIYNGGRTEYLMSFYSYHIDTASLVCRSVTRDKPLRNISLAANKSVSR